MSAETRGTQELDEGGYLWRGELRIWDNEVLMGWYVATEGAVRSKGTMYFALHQHGQRMTGRWVGLSYDGPIVTGWGAIAKTEEEVLASWTSCARRVRCGHDRHLRGHHHRRRPRVAPRLHPLPGR